MAPQIPLLLQGFDGPPMRRPTPSLLAAALAVTLLSGFTLNAAPPVEPGPWPVAKAEGWAREHPWLVGCNFAPSTAINQLEMWQADTFDLPTIDKELGWAEGLGMNTMRVFLHDLLWQQDADGFKGRLDQFLHVAEKHRIKPMLVLFD